MDETAKRKGRPKGRVKKALTIRLDSDLYELIKEYEKLVLEHCKPYAKVVDIHEAIYHAFFFTYQAGEFRGRDMSESLAYLVQYVNSKELRSMERFDYFHSPITPEQLSSFSSWLSAYKAQKQEREEYQRQRLETLRKKHETAQVKALREQLDRIREQLEVLENGE